MQYSIICIPTSAATCAAIMQHNIFGRRNKYVLTFDNEVNVVLCDTEIIAKAPARLLAAGIADSFAKLCEYSSPYSKLEYGQKGLGIFCGYTLANAANEILFQIGEEAYNDVTNGSLTQAVEECTFVNIALIGVISGLGGYAAQGKGRFAIAHALNEVIRNYYQNIGNKWLHGEIVGVGVLTQLAVNGSDDYYINKTRSLFKSIEPCFFGFSKNCQNTEDNKIFNGTSSYPGEYQQLLKLSIAGDMPIMAHIS